MKITVVDWGDDSYRAYGKASVIAEFNIDKYEGFRVRGGRLDFDGYPETIWVCGHQWSVYVDYDYDPDQYFVEVQEE